jgi:hypothetical protein
MRTHRGRITILALTLLAGTTSSAIAQSAEPSADPAMTPAWVTGTLTLAPGCTEPTSTTEAGVEHQRGFRCEPQTDHTLASPARPRQLERRRVHGRWRPHRGVVGHV